VVNVDAGRRGQPDFTEVIDRRVRCPLKLCSLVGLAVGR